MNKYMISVIIPLYNAGRYLDEAVDSLVNQTIGFKNIEVIIINDGSTDDSEDYALKLKKKYKNIVYFKKKNEGVSIARNTGLDLATGKYINFLDADDKWEYDAFEKAIKVLEENKEIPFVSVRRKKFEMENDYTQFDYMFKEDKIVNIFDNYDYIQVPCTSSIIRSEIAKKYKFDKNLILSEDAKYMLDLCLNEKVFYILSSTLFYYRIRESNDSALQKIQFNKVWYSFTSKNVYEYALNESKRIYNKIIPYAQYFVMYHLRWKYYIKPRIELTKKEEKEHINYLVKLIKQIDDDIIIMQRRMTIDNKIHVLNIKYNKNIEDKITYKDNELYFKNINLNPYNEEYIKILGIYEKKNSIVITGLILKVLSNDSFTCNDKPIQLTDYEFNVFNYFKEYSPNYKEFNIVLDKCNKIVFKLNNK